MKNLNLIMIAIIASLVFTVNISYCQHNHGGVDSNSYMQAEIIKDPVCGMEVEKNDSLMVLYNEKEYYFCSNKHLLTFLKQPQKFLGEQKQNTQKLEEHKMDGSMSHGMMGMSTPLMIIIGIVMVTAMVVGMSGVMR